MARERLIQANLRLVMIVARDYINLGLPLLNLILRRKHRINESRGSLRFEKGAKLRIYASWWIKQAIKRALANQGRTIRLPAHVVEKIAHVRRASAAMSNTLGREPTED